MKKLLFAALLLFSPLAFPQAADHQDKQEFIAKVCFSRKMIVLRMAQLRDEGMGLEQYENENPSPPNWTQAMKDEIQHVEAYVWGHSTAEDTKFADEIYSKCFDQLK